MPDVTATPVVGAICRPQTSPEEMLRAAVEADRRLEVARDAEHAAPGMGDLRVGGSGKQLRDHTLQTVMHGQIVELRLQPRLFFYQARKTP
jgi:hypothetical protein